MKIEKLKFGVLALMKVIPPVLSVSCYFQVHRALTVTCLLLTITGFVLVFVHAEGWSDVRL